MLATWPLLPVEGPLPILSTYGQWQEGGTFGMHFHEGIDILPVDNKIAVYPVENGQIKGVYSVQNAYESYMVVETNANVGWNYFHIVAGNNPNGQLWAPPMNVIGGGNQGKSQLGTVAAAPVGTAQHLHLDYGGEPDPYLAAIQAANPNVYPAAMGQVRRPIDDPLTKMPNLTDSSNPYIDPDIHFRVAAHEFKMQGKGNPPDPGRPGTLTWAGTNLSIFTNPIPPTPLTGVAEMPRRDNHYFGTDVVFFGTWRWVGALAPTTALDGSAAPADGKHQIDIIAGAWDKIGSNAVADKVGVKSIGFKITGMGAQTGDLLSFNFSGEFTTGGGNPGHHYGVLRHFEWTRVAYENDAYSDSTVGGTNWYTLTNTPTLNATAALVDKVNKEKFWNSKVKTGKDWNDQGNDATKNAEARFPDGFYTLTVTAKDAKGNEGTTTKKLLVDNFPQNIVVKPHPGTVNLYIEKGSHFLPNSPVDIWIKPPLEGPNGYSLTEYGGVKLLTVMTDSNGEFFNIELGPVGTGVIVADYDCDGYVLSQLDAVAPVQTEEGGGSSAIWMGNFAAFSTSASSSTPVPQPILSRVKVVGPTDVNPPLPRSVPSELPQLRAPISTPAAVDDLALPGVALELDQ